ncbi:phage tail protein [Sphingopyxis sp. GW247-27LB]|nr:phage tail protein [Sphingopyxis sp. GW247-27LB]
MTEAPSTSQIAPHSAAAYATQLAAMLPRGRAWPREDGSTLMQLMRAKAEELARVDGRVADLFEEVDPRSALELLADWERVAGLPDSCIAAPDSIAERQAAVHSRLTGLGGQSRAYFIGLAATLGFAITIDEFRPFRVGQSRVGDCLYDEAWAHAWRVNVQSPAVDDGQGLTLRYFRVGQSRVGERLVGFGSLDLECIIRRAAPAHSIVIFAYDIAPDPMVWFDFTAL